MPCVHNVVIVGGGIGGLTLAVALHQAGITVRLFERRAAPQAIATGLNLWAPVVAPLQRLGLNFSAIGAPLEQLMIEAQDQQRLTVVPVGEASQRFGADSYAVERQLLLQGLANLLPQDSIEWGKTAIGVDQIDHERSCLHRADGQTIAADLIVACDGIHSRLRATVAGPVALQSVPEVIWSAVTDAATADLPTHSQIDSWQSGGKGGLADVGRGRWRWYLTLNAQRAKLIQGKAELLQVAETWCSPLARAIALTPAEAIVQTVAEDLPRLPRWHDRRLVLLGDAAHATTPFAGMGACSAIGDALALAAQLKSQTDLATALATYVQVRKSRAEAIVRDSRFKLWLATLQFPPLVLLRNAAFASLPLLARQQIAQRLVGGQP
jgi:2-polyprenyl-6-methoxyphenol hydroxylase-like FAD-dependent oxidoreductase